MMNKRKIIINIHIILAATFLPLLLLMPITGTLYLMGFKGDQVTTEAFRVADTVPEDSKLHEQYFRDQFKEQNVDFDFEYIRSGKNDFTFRPSSRAHYVAAKSGDGSLVFSRVEPNLTKRLIEIHKGHGPGLMKIFQMAFGIGLVLTTLSGAWLAATIKPYRNLSAVFFVLGSAVIVICLL